MRKNFEEQKHARIVSNRHFMLGIKGGLEGLFCEPPTA